MPQATVNAFLFVLTLVAPAAGQTPSNDSPMNNGGDVVFLYSSPSSGATYGAIPQDPNGDLYWRALSGADFMANVDAGGAATMEIDGYYESIFDTDWATSPVFYTRTHGPALPGPNGTLEPAFFTLGFTTEVTVVIGPSGFGGPCTIAPSLCSPPGYSPCLWSGTGYLVDIQLGSTPGSGILLPADGTSGSDMATTWFVHGGMAATGGLCGLGDYDLQDVHSTDETPGDLLGTFESPVSGFQAAGSGPIPESILSIPEGHVTWRNPILNPVADSGAGLGVEIGDNGGGARNALVLDVSAGNATLGVELRDLDGAATAGNLAFVGASGSPLALPGLPILGGTLLVALDQLFLKTIATWQGSVTATTFVFTSEGAYLGAQLAVPAGGAGVDLYLQGIVLDPATFQGRTTNRVRVQLL